MDQTGSILLTEVLQQSHAEVVIPDMLSKVSLLVLMSTKQPYQRVGTYHCLHQQRNL